MEQKLFCFGTGELNNTYIIIDLPFSRIFFQLIQAKIIVRIKMKISAIVDHMAIMLRITNAEARTIQAMIAISYRLIMT